MDNRRFIADANVGKLAKWLRMLGYDTRFFDGSDDAEMVATALAENRIILTRDTQFMKRRVIASGRLTAILLTTDNPFQQMQEVIKTFSLPCHARNFTLCLECNQPLEERTREQVKDRVPPYVFKTQNQYVECPLCHRIYWKGTHWQAMTRKLEQFCKDGTTDLS
ncbi:MAG: Mut7-C RNAse domain-containing protein [Chloroflexota bacterium]